MSYHITSGRALELGLISKEEASQIEEECSKKPQKKNKKQLTPNPNHESIKPSKTDTKLVKIEEKTETRIVPNMKARRSTMEKLIIVLKVGFFIIGIYATSVFVEHHFILKFFH